MMVNGEVVQLMLQGIRLATHHKLLVLFGQVYSTMLIFSPHLALVLLSLHNHLAAANDLVSLKRYRLL